ncbi:hypothetical protein BDV19DRAFT_390497 [Aspergillus venezuelensis]
MPLHQSQPTCIDDSQSQMIDLEEGRVIVHPMSLLTRKSFTILLRRVTDIQRSLHDALCSISTTNPDSDRWPLAASASESMQGFEKTMSADEKLSSLTRALPAWLTLKTPTKDPKTAHTPATTTTNNNTNTNTIAEETENIETTQPYHSTMTRTLRIALLHLRIKTNRPFYTKGLTSRLFYFSAAACLESARSIEHGGLDSGLDEVERLAVVVNGDGGGEGVKDGGLSAWSDGERIPIPQVDELEVNEYLDQWLGMFDCDPGFGLQL